MPYYNEMTRQRVRDMGFGLVVERDAEAVAIVATPGDPFWDVHGLCVVTSIIGVCTVSCGGANNMFFRFNPDGTAATGDMTATADLGTTTVDGGVVALIGAPASGLPAGTVGSVVTGVTSGMGIACYEGVIGLVADAANGTWKWFLTYFPLENGAYIEVV